MLGKAYAAWEPTIKGDSDKDPERKEVCCRDPSKTLEEGPRRHFGAHQGCPLITGPEGKGLGGRRISEEGPPLQDSALCTGWMDPCRSTGL